MIDELLLFVAICLFLFALLKWLKPNYGYFTKRHLKCISSGTNFRVAVRLILKRIDITELTQILYQSFPDEPIVGHFDFGMPQYIVREPEAIKTITVKDFEYFEDHRHYTDEKRDKIWGNALFLMHGEKWRQMRATLRPAFSGSKMRQMFDLVTECVEDVIKYYQKKIKLGKRANVEMKDFSTRYTNDVIATCAFGLKINSFVDPKNAFYVAGKRIMDFGGMIFIIKAMVAQFLPVVARALNFPVMDTSSIGSFKQNILDTMEFRKRNEIYRPDMINTMMQIRERTLNRRSNDEKSENGFATIEESKDGKMKMNRIWTDDEIVSQCYLFFVAGFETTSTFLTFASYELMANPDIQRKLCKEIKDTEENLDGKRLTYEVLEKMKYLDQVICETLRKWPPSVQSDRICVKDYMYDDGTLKFIIEKGSLFILPIFGMQRDPKYFKEPEKFDPERFNDENKANIIPGSYIPFGIGPRNCIGGRFALMEIKTILYYLLLNFSFEPNEKSQIPVTLKKTVFALLPENGMHLELRPHQ